MSKVTKKEIRGYLKKMLGSSEKWATNALIKILANQTADEVQNEDTMVYNGIGFTGTDGRILTSLALQFKRRGHLSSKQMAIVLKKMPKYWKQVLQISDKAALEALVLKSR